MAKKSSSSDSSLPLHEVLEAEFVALHGELPSDYPRICVPPKSTRSMVDVGGAAAAVASLSLLLGMIPFIRSRFQARQPYWKYVWKWLLFAIPLSGISGALSSHLVTAAAVRSPTSAILVCSARTGPDGVR